MESVGAASSHTSLHFVTNFDRSFFLSVASPPLSSPRAFSMHLFMFSSVRVVRDIDRDVHKQNHLSLR